LFVRRSALPSVELLDLRSYYTRVGLWPAQPFDIDPEGWLLNFSGADDIAMAEALLDSFIHFNEKQTLKFFLSAFASLASTAYVEGLPGDSLESKWKAFRAQALVSFPAGEDESPTGSGYVFIRMARQRLELAESRLVDPAHLVRALLTGGVARPVVFVDDIVGSGDQFIETWTRAHEVNGQWSTLQEAVSATGSTLFYSPALCTELGAQAIRSRAPEVVLSPAHYIPAVYGALHPETILVPDDMRAALPDFVRRYAPRVGATESMAFGHARLGLAIAFDHSTPDLTLPIFWREHPGWTPLRTRR
jgi:hypothetical protein